MPNFMALKTVYFNPIETPFSYGFQTLSLLVFTFWPYYDKILAKSVFPGGLLQLFFKPKVTNIKDMKMFVVVYN